MKNKKGFTLIELLAVIVILAIIMVVAIPQILNVINNSRKSSWDSNVKLVAKSIDLNNTMDQTGVIGNGQTTSTGQTKGYPLSSLCSNGALTNFDKITEVGDINFSASSCSKSGNTYTFTLKGQNQFKNYEATIECTTSKACKILSKTYGTASSSGSGSEEYSEDEEEEQLQTIDHRDTYSSSYHYLATGYGYTGYKYRKESDNYTSGPHPWIYADAASNSICLYYYDHCVLSSDSYDINSSTGKVDINGENTQDLISDFMSYDYDEGTGTLTLGTSSDIDISSFVCTVTGNTYGCTGRGGTCQYNGSTLTCSE